MATLGVTAAATDISMDNMIELHHSVDPAYRSKARFMLNDATLLVLKKKKDGQGRYLWQSGIAVKEPDTLDGMPYTINQAMASIATTAKPVLFGDFSKYYIRKVSGLMVLRLSERYAELNQTAFVAFERADGALVDAGTHPLKYIANA
jgi:HK97 family phage major capsid protein